MLKYKVTYLDARNILNERFVSVGHEPFQQYNVYLNMLPYTYKQQFIPYIRQGLSKAEIMRENRKRMKQNPRKNVFKLTVDSKKQLL